MPKVKHRHSRERGRKRRTHYKAEEPAVSICSQCGGTKLPHHVCSHCGYYNGRQVKKIETVEERKARKDKKGKKK